MDLLLSFLFSGGLISVIIIIAVIALFFNFVPLGLWISAIAAGVNVGIFNLIGMRLRRVPASQIVLPLIKANKAGMDVNVNQLEAHYLAGGNVDRVIDALIAAHRAQIPLTFERSCAIDLAGRNVLEAVQMSVNPEVIETPVVSAVAKNGIELKVKARVTVRANIDRLVGGAGEATLAKALLPMLVLPAATPTFWKTRIIFPAPYWPKGLTPVLRLKFSRLILRTSM